jgi:OmpA-OmpF porin, OOP family
MPNFRPALVAFAATVVASCPRTAAAQQQAQGFAVDRLYLSAPGAGWFVMDTLDMHGGLGGAMALTTGYAHDPLRVGAGGGSQGLTVVADEALADFGFAATYDRFRLYINLDMPLDVTGNCGTVGAYKFTAPSSGLPFTPSGVNPETVPDAFADGRVGVDARLIGTARDAFRLGAGAQLLIPSPNTPNSEYLSDGTFRAMGRVLFAGDFGPFTYAGQLGIHIRPRDDSPVPEGPQGNELLFGAAAGAKLPIFGGRSTALVVGPEVFGASAFRSLFGSGSTALEGLLSGRIEGTADDGGQLRAKIGIGAGIDAQFGAPDWRIVFGVELFDHGTDRDQDGVTDSKDACPDTPGVRTKDPKTNGCPASSSPSG